MLRSSLVSFGKFAAAAAVAWLGAGLLSSQSDVLGPLTSIEAAETSDDAGPVPVEDDMHEFMEYAFEPNYKRLKAIFAKETLEGADFKAIKGDALSLAEGGNLLLFRVPDDNADEWKQHSTDVRMSGSELYQAGKKKDADAARASWKKMLMHCNACHDTFSGGDPNLKP